MVAQGGRGPWQPRGSGFLVAVVALSVAALLGHGIVALTLLRGTVHPSAPPPVSGPTPSKSSTKTPTPSGTSSPTSRGASALHLDHACMAADNPPTTAKIPANDTFGSDLTHLGPGAELQRLYAVKDRDLEPVDGAGPVRDCDRQLWRVVVGATSVTDRGYLKEFLVFDADASGSSSVGDVVAEGKDASRWRLSLAPNGATDLDVALTVAHEVGHLVALNPGQLATPQPAKCPTIDAGQGCLDQQAHLISFLASTWPDAEISEWNTAADISDQTRRDQALQDFYDRHHESFVDSYAATDPLEDFAESYAIWCAVAQDNPVLPQLIEGDPTDGHTKLGWFEHGSSGFSRDRFATCTELREWTR